MGNSFPHNLPEKFTQKIDGIDYFYIDLDLDENQVIYDYLLVNTNPFFSL